MQMWFFCLFCFYHILFAQGRGCPSISPRVDNWPVIVNSISAEKHSKVDAHTKLLSLAQGLQDLALGVSCHSDTYICPQLSTMENPAPSAPHYYAGLRHFQNKPEKKYGNRDIAAHTV